jgi:hypothetical protein
MGLGLQTIARLEIGGSPATDPAAYARRSPLAFARQLAFDRVPLQLWWSTADRVVIDQPAQSGRLFRTITALNRRAPVEAFVGRWAHSAEMRADLPLALARFGLLPARFGRGSASVHVIAAPRSRR